MSRLRAAFVVVALGALTVGCAPDPSDDPLVAGVGATVAALDNVFVAETLEVTAGTTVTWRNVGRNDHDIQPVDGSAEPWGIGRDEFAPGQEYQHAFETEGTYAYFCTIHGTAGAGMTGSIVVSAPAATSPGASTVADMAPEVTEVPIPTGSPDEPAATIRVPADQPSVQAAVDAAEPGALILVSPGTYHEQVDVRTDRLTIRGLDRNTVILDGQGQRDHGVRVLGADGVAVENMTVTDYNVNGFFWSGVDGYRGSYLTSYRTGAYGVYAFDAVNGQFDHVYAVGSPDAGIYVGQCFPCDAVIDQVVAEHNGLGYSGTNAGGNLVIVNSVFRNNRAGIVPNSGSYELCYPQRDTTIVGNLVYDNNQADTPAIDVALWAMGNGIVVAGGMGNVVERNRVFDHDRGGIALVPFLEETPNDSVPPVDEWQRTCAEARLDPLDPPATALFWNPTGNSVTGNVLADNRQHDLILAALVELRTLGNCFAGNTLGSPGSTAPAELEVLAPCAGEPAPPAEWAAAGTYDFTAWLSQAAPPSVGWRTASLPPLAPQQQMPAAASAPARPAIAMPPAVDLEGIDVPDAP